MVHGLLAASTLVLVNQVLAHCQHCLDPVSVGCQLCFKSLVLLVLALDVGGVFEALLRCHLGE